MGHKNKPHAYNAKGNEHKNKIHQGPSDQGNAHSYGFFKRETTAATTPPPPIQMNTFIESLNLNVAGWNIGF